MLCKVFLLTLRLPCILLAIGMWWTLHLWKFFGIFPVVIRWFERFSDKMVAQLLLNVTSFNNIKEQYHREDDGFDFTKWQKNELVVKKLDGDVFITNQTCFVDWLYLILNYSPVFTKIVIVKAQGNRKAGLRVLGLFETLFHAIGIKFPETINSDSNTKVYFSIKELKQNNGFLCKNPNVPVVVMPEGTKTNGLGIIDIEKGIIEMLVEAADIKENLRVHSIRFDHSFKYFAPYNTTNASGWSNFIACTSQFTSKYIVQFYFNINGVLKECQNFQDKKEFIKKTLMIRTKEQSLSSLSWREHEEFIKLWNQTADKKSYNV